MDNSALAARMKFYEQRYTDQIFMPLCPVVARLDGRAFHTFTRGLERPYDMRMSCLMVETTKHLVEQTNARCGYTQSDEISLVWMTDKYEEEIFFAGKLQKMNSILSSMASVYFNSLLPQTIPEKGDLMPLFDCRVFQVPNEIEAANCFIWREIDAKRNSVQMAARSMYSHNECMDKNSAELHEMLFQKGVNWDSYPNFFKRGSYIRRKNISRKLDPQELDLLPLKHHARENPDMVVNRSVVMVEDFPPMMKVANAAEVILNGEKPVMKKEE